MQCGIACLASICLHYGEKYSLNFLERFCHATTEGVSLKAISDGAEKLGLNAHAGLVSLSLLRELTLPAILHWNQKHFIILYRIGKNGNRFYISDPAKGNYVCSMQELEQKWISVVSDGIQKGVVMLFSPNDRFGSIKDESSNGYQSFSFLYSYVKQYKKYFSQIGLGLILGCVLQLLMPFLTQSIVDIGIWYKDINFIWPVLLGELMIVVGKTVTDFVRRRILLHISIRINVSLVSDFFIKLLRLPMSFFDTKLMGDLMQRIGDHSRVQSFLTNQVLGVIFTLLSFIIFGIVLFVYNKLIFLVFIVGSVIYGVWVTAFLKRRKMIDYELFEMQAISQNKTYQFITCMQEIKLQDCEQRRRWEWEDAQADIFTIQMKSLKLRQTQEAGSIFINEVKNILITVLAATAVINGKITIGAMLAVQYIVGQLNSPVEQLMDFIYSMQDVKISLERISEIHGREDEDVGKSQMFSIACDKSIIIQDIDFKYNPHSLKKTIDNVSFDIPKGKITAVVGDSGSGKTTLIKLMLGYYPVTSGSIYIAGCNINEYNLKWWRRQCGVVMQDGVIFSESIARNIAVDDGEINVSQLEKAAKIANIHDYILGLPLKYNTKIGRDGIGLSHGQKQRILIARAVYKNPDFIFLDEATNALDAKNERAIVDNLNEFYRGRTVIVVAHRLSTVKNADQIIVLDCGKVAEIGNHSSLIRKKGAYYNLVKNQLEL